MKRDSSSGPAPPIDPVPADSDRARRLLEAMHKVFSHDLPNQLVVVQSLAGLLREEEAQFSADGREALNRLQQAARRAGDTVHFLKDMARLARLAETVEEIRLSALAREVQAELNQIYPRRDIQVEANWAVPYLFAGRRSLHQAMIQLLRCGLDHYPNQAATLYLSSEAKGDALEMNLGVQPREGPLLPNAGPVRQDRTLPEQRLEFILARELLDLWGGTVSACPRPGRTHHFVIGIPAQPS